MKIFTQTEDYKKVEEYAISYLKMRRLIGIFGFALPLTLLAGTFLPKGLGEIQPSISEYYDTYLRDVFVGVLCAVALFLFVYRGFNRLDSIAANCACFFALGVAFFPSSSDSAFIHYFHLFCAALFFITLALISLFLFTRTRKG